MAGFFQSVAIGSDYLIVSNPIGGNRGFEAGEIETRTLGGVTQVLFARPIGTCRSKSCNLGKS